MPVGGGVGDGVRLEQRGGLSRVELQPGRAEVDQRVRARAFVAEPARECKRQIAPQERLLGVLREHRELREPAVGASELDRLAERLEKRDRLERLRPRRRALAREPVQPRKEPRAPAHGRLVAELALDLDRALDRGERVVEPAHDVRDRRQLLERGRLLGRRQPVDEVRRRAGSASTPRGSTRSAAARRAATSA